MSKSESLLNSLRENVVRIDAVLASIKEIKNKKSLNDMDLKNLESLHRAEFSLYLDNSSIYDDLMEEIENESDFTRRRIAKEANSLLKSEIIEIGGY